MNQKDRATSLRLEIAHEAARIVAESGRRDFRAAKRKAAERLGATERASLPSNREIELALADRQRLFRSDAHHAYVGTMLECAADAMQLLETFHPRLVGSLLDDTADENSEVTLHLFAEPAEAVGDFLGHHRVPFLTGERRMRYAGDRTERIPAYRYAVDEVSVELLVFPLSGQRQAPLSPIDGRPMRRGSPRDIAALRDAHAAQAHPR